MTPHMHRPFARLLTPWLGAVLVALVCVPCASAQDYRLQSIQRSPGANGGHVAHFVFRTAATNATTLVVTLHSANAAQAADRRSSVIQSLRSMVPVRVTYQDHGGDDGPVKTVITMRATPRIGGKPVENELAFDLTQPPAGWRLEYDLAEATGLLSASLRLHLDMETNARETNVNVTYETSRAAFSVTGVDLSGRIGRQINVQPLTGYTVQASRQLTAVVSDDNTPAVTASLLLQNLGAAGDRRDLPGEATLTLRDTQDRVAAVLSLQDEVLREEEAYLAIDSVPANLLTGRFTRSVKTTTYEARRVNEKGELVYIPWITRKAAFVNLTTDLLSIRLLVERDGARLHTLDVELPPSRRSEVLVPIARSEDNEPDLVELEREFNLVNVRPNPSSADALAEVGLYTVDGAAAAKHLRSRVAEVAAQHAILLETMATGDSLASDKLAVERARDGLLRLPYPPLAEVERLRQQLFAIEDAIEDNRRLEALQRGTLVQLVFP